MCLKYVRIKNHQQSGICDAYVPCGVCADCRREKARAWGFRLCAEFMYLIRKGWHVAFCTLTYRDENLPYIPMCCFKHEEDYKEIPCFSRSDCRTWIEDVRQHCKRNYGFVKENRIRYFVSSELGSLRHRPHYHAILAWPSSLGYEEMHRICTNYWQLGYLFPRDCRGDKGMLPFQIVGDATKCFHYVAKYVCKDLELDKLQKDIEFYCERGKYEEGTDEDLFYRSWRNCQSFHIQSQSLGFEAIRHLSDDEKLDIYRNGMAFTGDGNVYQVPMYIKNKLVYDPWYVYDEDGNRLVKRKASAWFEKYKHEIFEAKAEFYQRYCRQSESVEYWVKNGLDEQFAKELCSFIRYYRKRADKCFCNLDSDNNLGRLYLAFCRVDPNYRFEVDLCEQWMSRFHPERILPFSTDYELNHRLSWLDNYWCLIDKANSMIGSFFVEQRAKEEEDLLEVLDFFNNITK